MAVQVIVPAEGGMDTCLIAEWKKQVGDKVAMGDQICEVETDKAVIDVMAPCDGYLISVLYEEGEDAPTLTPIAYIGAEGESIERESGEAFINEEKGAKAPELVAENVKKEEERVLASPRAKRAAKEQGAVLEEISGTGFMGSIVERDVLAAVHDLAAEHRNGQVHTTVDMGGIRRASGKHLLKSLQNTAQYTLETAANAEVLLSFRKRLKENEKLQGITINDMVMYAVARALKDCPLLNCVWQDKELRQHQNINLGYAVSTERGLIVPVVHSAQKMSLLELSDKVKECTKRVRNHEQPPEELKGGTFTVSNLGTFGIRHFTPILNYPEVGILGVGKITLQPVQTERGVEFQNQIALSLTLDHQVVDGVPGAEFLKRLCKNIEEIDLLALY